MGLFDRDAVTGLDAMFDLNRDGKIDMFEQGLELEFMDAESRPEEEDDSDEPDGFDFDEDF